MDWRRWPNEAFATAECYTAYVGSLPTFRDSLSLPSSRVKQSKKNFSWTAWHLKTGPLECPEMTVNNYQPKLHNIPEERKPQLQCGESLKSLNLITWPPRSFELRPLVFFLWGCKKKSSLCLTIVCHFAKTCWEDMSCYSYSYIYNGSKCMDWTWIEMCYVRLPTLPSLKICELLSMCLKKDLIL
jgi:hypothetical protein